MNPNKTTFQDTEGNTWDLALNVATIKRVKSLTSIDLLAITDSETFIKLLNPMTLADVLYVVVQPAAEHRQIDSETFGSLLGGDAIDEATGALLEAIVLFSRPAQREALRQSIHRFNELEAEGCEKVIHKIDQVTLPAGFGE